MQQVISQAERLERIALARANKRVRELETQAKQMGELGAELVHAASAFLNQGEPSASERALLQVALRDALDAYTDNIAPPADEAWGKPEQPEAKPEIDVEAVKASLREAIALLGG